jgi:hypothetical protein
MKYILEKQIPNIIVESQKSLTPSLGLRPIASRIAGVMALYLSEHGNNMMQARERLYSILMKEC